VKVTVARDAVALDSPMEALFYGLCCFHEIPVERVMLSAAGEPGGPLWWYWPGFRIAVPGSKAALWVEISDGQNDSALRPCRAAWRQSGHRLAVLYREELHVLMTRANSHVVMEQLKIWAR
jgi:hypothetical protein